MKFNKTLRKKCNTINILPSDEGVMVDYHTKKKLSPSTKSIITQGKKLLAETKSGDNVFSLYDNQP